MRGWIALFLLAAGCGNGTGAVAGAIFVDPCTQNQTFGATGIPNAYNMHPSYFAADMIYASDADYIPQNRVIIREQSGGQQIDEADGLYIRVANSNFVGNAVGTDIPVGPDTNVRASLLLNSTCPAHPVTMELDGTINFSSFGSATAGSVVPSTYKIVYGNQLTATFNFTLVDRRVSTLGGIGSVPDNPMVGGNLSGNFDFTVKPGRGAQAYP
jgi:hypothetical protein